MEDQLKINKTSSKITKVFPIFLFLFIIVVLIICPRYSSDTEIERHKNKLDSGIVESISVNSKNKNNNVENIKDNLLYGNIILDSTNFFEINITVYNKFDYDLMFEGAITDINDKKIYSNRNIDYQVQGLNIGDIIPSKTRKTLTLFFRYKDITDKSNADLTFYLNLAFKNDTMVVYDDTVTFVPYHSDLPSVYLPEIPNCLFSGYFDENDNQYYSADGFPLKLNTDLRVLILHSKCE